jgi:5-methylcytosine-specific restriction endonuclease McrA
MGRTLVSKRLRYALWRAADGKCQLCGRDLDPDDWHADHITPWSKTGRTNVHEMQALCPHCNLKKGDRCQLENTN